jgi:hypothetical protein
LKNAIVKKLEKNQKKLQIAGKKFRSCDFYKYRTYFVRFDFYENLLTSSGLKHINKNVLQKLFLLRLVIKRNKNNFYKH